MKCPNCGQEFNGGRCPHCGYSTSKSANRVVAIVILVFLVVPAALFGACSAIVAVDSVGGSSKAAQSAVGTFGVMALAGIAAFVGGLFLVVKLWRG